MKCYLKTKPSELGQILKTYITPEGQKRLTVSFPHSVVDATVETFEVVGE